MSSLKDIKSIFFGTPKFAVHILEELKDTGHIPTLIITMPDKPQGRELVVTPPEVKVWAVENNVDVMQPEKLDRDIISELKNSQWDIFLVVAYGKILPKDLLDIPKHGTLNVHPSLLPKYRGSSPIESQILADDRETGVTIMLMDEKLDHGPIISQARLEIAEEDWPLNKIMLENMLATEGGNFLAETVSDWVDGKITAEPQDEKNATYTKKIKKEDGEIDLTKDSKQNFLKIQAFEGWPGTYFFTERNDKEIRVKIIDAELQEGKLILRRVLPEGKKEMDYKDFMRGQSGKD